MPSIPKKDLPAFVRRCVESARKQNESLRKNEIERLKMYVGGEDQWLQTEIRNRKEKGRPIVTVNKCKPAVDQIEGDIRMNPPGPQIFPVGGTGSDGDGCDIIAGLIREVEYRSHAMTAYSTAGKYVAASGYAVLELDTEYVSDRGNAQQLVIKGAEDPAVYYFDPAARMPNRQDAKWAAKLRMYATREEYIAAFGSNRKILKSTATGATMGYIQDLMGINGDYAQIQEWSGNGKGPFFVVEFYYVEEDREEQNLCSDGIWRFESEEVPPGVTRSEKPEESRMTPRKKFKKYIVDAIECLDETEWLGTLIPWFPVLGPEVYIEGKLHRMSLIAGAIGPQRALNYVATTMTEMVGIMPKSPWIGPRGSFDDPRWETANSEIYAFMEYDPVMVTDEAGGQTMAPPPQRNQWEAPIQWAIALYQTFSDAIKSVTAIYDPSLGAQKNDQSGKAIEQLRSESSVGNYSYSDNLHRAIGLMYGEMCVVLPKILDGTRAATIVRPDSQHELITLNKMFPPDQPKPEGKEGKANNITLGQYTARVDVGPNQDTRNKEAIVQILDFLKINPQVIGNPAIAAKVLRLIGHGNPKVSDIADLISPDEQDGVTTQQMQQQLGAEKQKNQQLTIVAQRLHDEIKSKLPQIQADKYKSELDALTKIRVAEINASKDMDKQAADNEASQLESMMGMAHEHALTKIDHEHQHSIADKQAAVAAASQASDQMHQSASQAADHQAAAEQQEAAQEAGGE